MANATKNKIRIVHYWALNFNSNVTDFNIKIIKPNGQILHPSPIVQNLGEGVYSFSYTPNMSGIWLEQITSQNNHDEAHQSVIIENYDLDDIYNKLSGQHGGGHF